MYYVAAEVRGACQQVLGEPVAVSSSNNYRSSPSIARTGTSARETATVWTANYPINSHFLGGPTHQSYQFSSVLLGLVCCGSLWSVDKLQHTLLDEPVQQCRVTSHNSSSQRIQNSRTTITATTAHSETILCKLIIFVRQDLSPNRRVAATPFVASPFRI